MSLRNERGFGLIDFIVGTAIAAILLPAIVGVFHLGYQTVRVANEATQGNLNLTLLTTYLTRDGHAAPADAQLVSAGSGTVLELGLVDPATDRFLRVTYAYTSDGTQGTITRTARVADQVVDSRIVARGLEPLGASYPTVFAHCADATSGTCPSISATVAYRVNGTLVVRTIAVALRARAT